ncbi:hypothetical protein BRD56_07635 [Thermoplasmatales archaeon SW_10_69_26]|nr:MAG: hypothetical protein BRD56_07635 [Thermoplasmatales archaeon SW_10_69_26]
MEAEEDSVTVETTTAVGAPLGITVGGSEDRVSFEVVYDGERAAVGCDTISECVDELIVIGGDLADIVLQLASDIIQAVKDACGHYCDRIVDPPPVEHIIDV